MLDVAAGNGMMEPGCGTALVRRHSSTDYVPSLLAAGRAARQAETMPSRSRADAEALPFADATFDVVVSTFGVIFTPATRKKAAGEALRLQAQGQDRPGPAGRPTASHRPGVPKTLGLRRRPLSRRPCGARADVRRMFAARPPSRPSQCHFNFRYRSIERCQVFRATTTVRS